MPQIKQLSEEATRFVRSVKRAFSPSKMILFGSRARGDALSGSDYDFIVISGAFEGTPFIGRATRILTKCAPSFPVDLLCYSPKEFELKRRQIGTVAQAVAEGIPV